MATIERAEPAPPPPSPSLGERASALVDWAVGRHRRALALLAVLALVCFLPGFFNMPPVDRDEARFAQATKQMLDSGDFVDIRFQDEARHKKPVGIYWLQAAVVGAAEAVGVPQARTRIWLYRLPSLAGAVGGVLLVYWAALAFVGRRGALLAAAMLASSILLGVEARLAKTDAVLFLAIVAAQGALAHAFARRERPGGGWGLAAVFWTAIAAGVLVKGPIILLVTGATALGAALMTRSGRWLLALKPWAGVPWALLLILPWFVAISLESKGAFFAESVGRDLVGKMREGQENHWGPPGYHLALLWMTFWPAAPLVLFAAPAVWRDRSDPKVLFLLAWLVPTWVLFEAIPTKLPHYVLPLYPALAILAARALEEGGMDVAKRWWTRRAAWWWPGLAIVAPALALTGLLLFHRGAGFAAWPFLVMAGWFGFAAVDTLRREGAERAFLVAIPAAVAVYVAVLQVLIPATRTYFPAASLVAAAQAAGCGPPQMASAGYREPSLVFLGGTDVELVDPPRAAEFLRRGGCRVVFVDARQERSFALRAETLGVRYRLVTVIKAVNYNGGRRLNLAVFATVAD